MKKPTDWAFVGIVACVSCVGAAAALTPRVPSDTERLQRLCVYALLNSREEPAPEVVDACSEVLGR